LEKLIRGFAFDLEGTIIDIERLHHLSHIRAARALGIDIDIRKAKRNLFHFIGGPDEAVAEEMAALSTKKVSVEDLLMLKNKFLLKSLGKENTLFCRKGFGKFIEWAKGKKVPLAIGTVTSHLLAIILLEKVGILIRPEDFALVTKEDVKKPKPFPDVYQETARRMKILAQNQLVFEDSIVGLQAALRAGSQVITIPTMKTEDFICKLKASGARAVFQTWDDPGLYELIDQLI